MADLDLDAIVLADDPLSSVKIGGLSARERALRVVRRVGATRIYVVDSGPRDGLIPWRDGRTNHPLLVIRADQMVHTPLVAPLIDAMPEDGVAVAVGPDDRYAGAYVASGVAARRAITAIAKGENNAAFVGAADAARIKHGEIARHSLATRADRSAAERLLYRIVVKPQDNAITRYLFRPVSSRLTRLLVATPITPNQVSLICLVMVAVACWLTAHASMNMVIAGTTLMLAATYVDCCDGEIARIKLMTSKFGAWVDTIVDEASTIGYLAALGWHCHLVFGHPGFDLYVAGDLIGVAGVGWSVYCIYYNIIVAVGSANSQDYVGRFEVVPGSEPNAVRLAPAAPKAIAPARELPPWLASLATVAPYIIRRDFIAWISVLLAGLHLTYVAFWLLVLGGVLTAAVTTIDHLRLRKLRRSILDGGQKLESPAA